MPGSRDAEFRSFAAARAAALRRTAFLLCGDWHEAEDLVQAALTKVYVAWPRVRVVTAEAYARQVLTRAYVDSRRRHSSRERPVDRLTERPVSVEDVEGRLDLLAALDHLPPGQRAVVVLRYWDDASIAEVARQLGLRPGTVKSQAARGLDRLRDVLGKQYVGGA